MKIRSFMTAAFLGAAVVTATGREFLSEVTSGTNKAAKENLPELVDLSQTVGSNVKDAAPDGVLSNGDVVIPMDTLPTTVQGLG